MADNKIVTDDLVAEVAEKLTAAGEKVTNRAVWSAIGGGSMTTISSALRRWREQQELQPEQKNEMAPAPDEVYEEAKLTAERIWAASQRVREQEIEELSNSMNERVMKANGERDAALVELQATAEELQAAQEVIKEQAATAAAAAAAAVAETERLNAEVARLNKALTDQIDAARSANVALTETRKRVDQLTDLLNQERTERAAAAERAAMAERQAATLTAQESAQRERADDLVTRLKHADERAEVLEKRAEALDQRIQVIEGEIKEAIREVGNQRAAAEAARGEAAEARHAAKEAHEASQAAQAVADELRNQLAAQEQALKARNAELAEKQQPKKG